MKRGQTGPRRPSGGKLPLRFCDWRGGARDGRGCEASVQPFAGSSASVAVSLGGLALAACQQGLEAARRLGAPACLSRSTPSKALPTRTAGKVSAEVASQASARRIEIVSGESQPRYRLKGYLTAYSTERRRDRARLSSGTCSTRRASARSACRTTTLAKGQADDPWAKIGESQISKATVAEHERRRRLPGQGNRRPSRGGGAEGRGRSRRWATRPTSEAARASHVQPVCAGAPEALPHLWC